MGNKLLDFSKCFYSNKASLLGLGLTSYGTVDIALNFSDQSTSTMIPGVLLLLATSFGTDTYNSYNKMKKHIKHSNEIDSRFRENMSGWYCDKAGYKLALKEKGLEELL